MSTGLLETCRGFR